MHICTIVRIRKFDSFRCIICTKHTSGHTNGLPPLLALVSFVKHAHACTDTRIRTHIRKHILYAHAHTHTHTNKHTHLGFN